ncbi:Uncharacterized protein YyaL [hydrothermal vent metagenome]|uniref:Uncharacterized protein YyaL n=1 Tax=hydrothermal vent metagenome TaxID=652676 RepID=A0A3B1BBV3_9ZZZZ
MNVNSYTKIASRLSAAILVLFLAGWQGASAYTHKKLSVKFLEYQEDTFTLAKERNKPVFMLISAVWCYWCHVFEEGALSSEKVYSYLNENFVNVFIDADARRDLLARYQAKTLPYVVFLNPDGSILRKYGGVLEADDFLGLLKTLKKQVASGKPDGAIKDQAVFSYSPPSRFSADAIREIDAVYKEIFQENFDEEEYGLGAGKKYILPETFLYFIDNAKGKKNEFTKMVDETLKKAVGAIYDPVEGGFFRYAETHDWRVPHYEKMLDVNSSALSLLLKANALSPSGALSDAARGTAGYLSSNLFDDDIGAFLSFQVADTSYYRLPASRREKTEKPAVIRKVFVDTLSKSMASLLDTAPYTRDDKFAEKIRRSIEFLADMMDRENNVYHYYLPDEKKWFIKGTLADHANLALLFARSYKIFKKPEHLRLARDTLGYARAKFFDAKLGIYKEGSLADLPSMEYLLGLNSIIAKAWLEIPEADRDKEGLKIAKNILRYFSGMADLLGERAWAARDFGFMEAYAEYLSAFKLYPGK